MKVAVIRSALALIAGLALCASLPAPVQAAQGKFFVPTGERTGFGAFEESRNSPAALRNAFGPPANERVESQGFTCAMSWPEIGVVAELVAFGSASSPCSEGAFVEARLTDPRWHTASGARPGGPKSAARRASLRRCTPRVIGCGLTGYALELHPIVCANTLAAGVLAQVRGHRVISLVVRWRSCE